MSPRPDVSAQRVPQILDAALRVFARQGVAGASVAEIATEAGLSKALVFMYFNTKDALLVAVVVRVFAQLHSRLEVLADSEGPLRTVLAQWCDALAQTVSAEGQAAVNQELLARGARDPAMQEVIAQAYSHYRAAFAGLVEKAIVRGEVRDVDGGNAAESLIALIEGTILLWLVSGQHGDLAQALRARMDLFFDGLAIRPGSR